jgi:hypothetical protein
MASEDEIERRVEEVDSATTARRAAAAKQIGALARRRAAVAEQLNDIETELGEVLAAAHDVIGVDELARFTDVPAADLTRWLDGRKPARTKRQRSTTAATSKNNTSHGAPAAKTPSARTPSGPTTADTPARLPVNAT